MEHVNLGKYLGNFHCFYYSISWWNYGKAELGPIGVPSVDLDSNCQLDLQVDGYIDLLAVAPASPQYDVSAVFINGEWTRSTLATAMAQTIGRLTPHDGGCSITITAAREVTVFYLFLQLLGNQGQPATLLTDSFWVILSKWITCNST